MMILLMSIPVVVYMVSMVYIVLVVYAVRL